MTTIVVTPSCLTPKNVTKMQQPYPILEYDADDKALIMPGSYPKVDMPEHCVICFFRDVVNHFVDRGVLTRIIALTSEMGEHPVYVRQYGDRRVALLQQGVGAPLAVGLLEETISLRGAQIYCLWRSGGVGSLDCNGSSARANGGGAR